jgi:hypothetical protein
MADKCPICEGDAVAEQVTTGDWLEFSCEACGTYRISGTALEVFPSLPRSVRQLRLESAKNEVLGTDQMPMVKT